MFAALRGRITFANAVSLIALFVALGGTSVAAISLTRNSVKARHIAPNAVSSPKVKDRSLRARDFARGQLPSGPKGDRGEKGDVGAPGTPGAAVAYARVSAATVLDASRSKGVNGVVNPVGEVGGLPATLFHVYCFDLSVDAKNAVATVEAIDTETTGGQGGPALAQASVGPDTQPDCAQPHRDASVVTFRSKTGSQTSADFYVVFN